MSPPLCEVRWFDGWGEHVCHLHRDHEGDHRCHCDAVVRDIPADDGL